MLWNFGQGQKSKSSKCVVIHLFNFPLLSKCLHKDSDCRFLFLCSVWIQHFSLAVQIDHTAVSASWVLEDCCFPPNFYACRPIHQFWSIDRMHAYYSSLAMKFSTYYVTVFLLIYYQVILKMYCTVLYVAIRVLTISIKMRCCIQICYYFDPPPFTEVCVAVGLPLFWIMDNISRHTQIKINHPTMNWHLNRLVENIFFLVKYQSIIIIYW